MSVGGFTYENQYQQNNEGVLQIFDEHHSNATYDYQIKEVHQEETVHDSFDNHD